MSTLTERLLAWAKEVQGWERDLLLSDEAWSGDDGLPRFTQGLYDRWLELQAERNALLDEGRASQEATK